MPRSQKPLRRVINTCRPYDLGLLKEQPEMAESLIYQRFAATCLF